VSGHLTYGGVVRPDRRRPLHYERVEPGDQPREAETMNGNCVLIPREVVARIGNLAAAYTHGMGDYDYGHRATRAGAEVWVAPGTIGTCSRNPARRPAESFEEHRQRATSPTGGLPPVEWLTFARRWAGPLWPLYAASPYLRQFARWVQRR
jgi:GT2 family glycosyltransferase